MQQFFFLASLFLRQSQDEYITLDELVEKFGIDESIYEYAATSKHFIDSLDSSSGISIKSSADPLSYLQVYAAYSSVAGGYEYFGVNDYCSDYDHGGTLFYIYTIELGYGFSYVAELAGNELDLNAYSYITDDGEVVGWIREWDACGYSGGRFTYENTSVNYPYNTMYDWIYIQ